MNAILCGINSIVIVGPSIAKYMIKKAVPLSILYCSNWRRRYGNDYYFILFYFILFYFVVFALYYEYSRITFYVYIYDSSDKHSIEGKINKSLILKKVQFRI